jgi:hypothetical protein
VIYSKGSRITPLGVYSSRFLRGRPPFFPFRRAASDLASLLTRPPRRPSATAAGFFRGMALHQEAIGLIERDAFFASRGVVVWLDPVGVVHVSSVGALGLLKGFAQALSLVFSGLFDVFGFEPNGQDLIGASRCVVCHRSIKPNRLGFVKRQARRLL